MFRLQNKFLVWMWQIWTNLDILDQICSDPCFYTKNSAKMKKMANRKFTPRWGGQKMYLFWESPVRGGDYRKIPLAGGGFTPSSDFFTFFAPGSRIFNLQDADLSIFGQKCLNWFTFFIFIHETCWNGLLCHFKRLFECFWPSFGYKSYNTDFTIFKSRTSDFSIF